MGGISRPLRGGSIGCMRVFPEVPRAQLHLLGDYSKVQRNVARDLSCVGGSDRQFPDEDGCPVGLHSKPASCQAGTSRFETALTGWVGRIRTRKCRFEEYR